MVRILNIVAENRLRNAVEGQDINYQIQLSSFLMSKAIDDMNKTLADHSKLKQDLTMNEFSLSVKDKQWTIRNRAYRDDTNDIDVEEALYNEISRLRNRPMFY